MVSAVLLVDGNGTGCGRKALDIQQSAPVDGFHTRVEAPTIRRAWRAARVQRRRPLRAPSSEWSGEDALANCVAAADLTSETRWLVCAARRQTDLLLLLTREGASVASA
jgi:hypothetical protein